MVKTNLEIKGFLTFLILHEIKYKPLTGDQLASRIGNRKNAKLTPGTIYPPLKQLRELKLVYVDQIGREKYYSMTKEGKIELENLYIQFSNYFYGLKNQIRKERLK